MPECPNMHCIDHWYWSQNGWCVTVNANTKKLTLYDSNTRIYFRLWIAGDRGICGGIQVQSFFVSRNKCLWFTVSVVPFLLHLGLFHLVQVQVVRPGGWKLFSSFLPWIILMIQAVPWFLQYMHTKNQRNFPAFPKTCKVPGSRNTEAIAKTHVSPSTS